MVRSVARWTTMAAVVLFAGCGGGSGSKSAGTRSVGGSSGVVSAKQGAFRTVTPVGFKYTPSAPQYYATGPEVDGQATSLVVTREPLSLGSINTWVRRIVRAVRQQRKAQRLSHPFALSVDGEPALAVDYGLRQKSGEWHARQVLVSHGEWVYFIRELSLPTQYAVGLDALDELLRNWHWQ